MASRCQAAEWLTDVQKRSPATDGSLPALSSTGLAALLPDHWLLALFVPMGSHFSGRRSAAFRFGRI